METTRLIEGVTPKNSWALYCNFQMCNILCTYPADEYKIIYQGKFREKIVKQLMDVVCVTAIVKLMELVSLTEPYN